MSAPTRRRWTCETCGLGVLAPGRMVADDVRRYCLDCSAASGRLVRRTCPALDGKRVERKARYNEAKSARQKRERAAARAEREQLAATKLAAAKREAERQAAARDIAGFDAIAEAERIWNLPYTRTLKLWRPSMPRIYVHHSSCKDHSSGHASGRSYLHVTVGSHDGWALGVLLHELVHCVTRTGRSGSKRDIHTDEFWTVLRSLARAAYPDAEFRFHEPAATDWAKQKQVGDGLGRWLVAVRGRVTVTPPT